MKINLDKTTASLKIISTIAGAIIGLFAIYTNIDGRMDAIEREVATNKGVQHEWMRNMENNVEKIYNVVKEWEKE
jgi:hypothetical protein